MPIISIVGARSFKIRLLYTLIFGVLILGGATMIYPFCLMLTGSMKSEADLREISPYPKFWFDDLILFRKYAESKHNVSPLYANISISWGRPIMAASMIQIPSDTKPELLEPFLEWRRTDRNRWWFLGHSGGTRMLPKNARLYRRDMVRRFDGDINAYGKAVQIPITGWNDVWPTVELPSRFTRAKVRVYDLSVEFAKTRPVEDRVIMNIDGDFRVNLIMPKYGMDIAAYNESHGTSYATYNEVLLPTRAPRDEKLREDWENFVRTMVRLDVISIDPSASPAFGEYIEERHGDIATYNRVHGTTFGGFENIKMHSGVPKSISGEAAWEAFIREACPLDALEIYGPRQSFEEFLAEKRGVSLKDVTPSPLPIAAADYHDCIAQKRSLRWEFTKRNYVHVLGYVARHGNGLINTIIYCALAIITALIVNPLAAYALSRYRPPSTYTILLFCMATMAFPGEVAMIPSFLLLKKFPLWPLLGGFTTLFVTFILLKRTLPHWPEQRRALIAIAVGCFVGAYFIPIALGLKYVSLLNTFAALVLPGMANGFMIFMLKGFFDSLPQELYEAAEIDGANEWSKFWIITMSLSKPILAVFALSAFTGAYSAFMMALIIIPDQSMWTLMVWVFQLQSKTHESVVFASLVITAIPTFLVFAFCQNIIIRGIVVPVDK
jgi:multiple sugar transport system permease protein